MVNFNMTGPTNRRPELLVF